VSAESGKVLVSGVSGPIGAALLPFLKERGYQVTRLVRGEKSGDDQIQWDPSQPVSPQSVSGFDAVIHLAGESIVGRWSASKKRRILDSRVQGTRNLAEALSAAPQKPSVFITGSAIGFYGNRGEEVLREDSKPGRGFLPTVCREWEAAAAKAQDAGIRTAHIRTGLVLSPKGGALTQMLTPFKLGVGGRIGNGRQWWSWIHVEDMAGAIHHAITANVAGPVNLTAPAPVRNAEFTKILAGVLSRPAIFPVPAFVVRLAFGEMGDELLLASQRVEPAKLSASGYVFKFPELKAALAEILKK
jgi:uncharacterized protein (TIGR01777 family)